jgi:uncharacterized membrane protein
MLIGIKEKIMTIGQDRRGIGVFSTKQDAEFALNALRDSGFPMDKVSMIAKDDGDDSIRGTDLNKKPGHEVVKGAEVGAFTGTVFGLLAGLVVGMSTLTIPGIGTVVVAGTILETLATTLAGAGIGAASGSLVGALTGWGIPGDRAKVYSERLTQGDYLIIIEGKSDEVMRAENILLNNRGLEEWAIYDAHSHDTPQPIQA